MALQMDLNRGSNHLYVDWIAAYWVIENIRVGNQDGIATVAFDFCAYPSREARLANLTMVSSSLPFGGPARVAVEPVLYQWTAVFPATAVFGESLPLTEAGQRAVLYPFVKSYLGLTEAVDVLEE